MITTATKWGNSLGIRIPSAMATQIGITSGTPVELHVEDNHIVIEKICNLELLLSQITPENLHTEEDTGNAVGGEAW